MSKLRKAFYPQNILGELAWRRSICMGAPSYQQLVRKFGYSEPYVSTAIFQLERQGCISRNAGYERSMRIVECGL